MINLLSRETWTHRKDETYKDFEAREHKQKEQFRTLKQERGACFMIKYGADDIRPIWESSIDPDVLREEIRAPDGLPWDCPLCQPYDSWYGRGLIQENRQYMTRIVEPNWYNGCVEEDGVYSKCICFRNNRAKRTKKRKEGINT